MTIEQYILCRGGWPAGPMHGGEWPVFRDYKRRGYFVVLSTDTYYIVHCELPADINEIDKPALSEGEERAILAAIDGGNYKEWGFVNGSVEPRPATTSRSEC